MSLASSKEGFAIKMEYSVQDTIPKQRPGNVQNDNTNKEQPKTERRRGIKGTIKSVPRARRQAKPNIVKPNIDVIKPVKPLIKPKIKAPVRVKVKV